MKKNLIRGAVAGAAAVGLLVPLGALPAVAAPGLGGAERDSAPAAPEQAPSASEDQGLGEQEQDGEAAAEETDGLATAAAPAAGTELQLLNITDFHGRISEAGVNVASVVERERAAAAEAGAETAFISSGDNIGASTYVSSSQQDTPTLDVLNAIGLDVSAAGNHEFDRGYADLRDRVGAESDFAHLGANVYAKGTKDVAAGLKPWEIVEAGDLKVGVIGVVTQDTATLVSPDGIADIEFGDSVEAINQAAAELEGLPEEQRPDVTVLNAHAGPAVTSDLDSALASNAEFKAIVEQSDPSIDAMFMGHSHLPANFSAPVPGTDRERPILQSQKYGEAVGSLTLTADGSGEWTTDDASLLETKGVEVSSPVVDEVRDIVADAEAQAKEIGSTVVGTITEDITRATTDGSEDRGKESTLGNLVADALKEGVEYSQLEEADFGLTNSGGLRTDLLVDDIYNGEKPGEVTVAELNAVLPFANDHGVVTLTGADVLQVFEEQWQPEGASRPMLHLGVSEEVGVVYDSTAPKGERVLSVTVDGEEIDPEATYRVATLSFLASGGDNYAGFANGTFEQSGLTDFDVWEKYFEENTPVSPDHQERQADYALDVMNTGELTASLGSPERAQVEQGAELPLTFDTEATREIEGPFLLSLELPAGFTADLTAVDTVSTAAAETAESTVLPSIAEGTTSSDLTVTAGDDVAPGTYTVQANLVADPEHAWWDDNPKPLPSSVELEVQVVAAGEGGDDDGSGNDDGSGSGDGQDDGSGDGDGSGSGDDRKDDSRLPRTGAEFAGALGLAAVLVAAGGTALAASRRRKSTV